MESDNVPPGVYVEILSGERLGEHFPISRKTITIGRDPSCDLCLKDPYVSRKHCQIVFRGDHFTVVDLGSLNRTRVKQKQYIQKNLKDGYEMSVGNTRLRFAWPDARAWLAEHNIEEQAEEESDE